MLRGCAGRGAGRVAVGVGPPTLSGCAVRPGGPGIESGPVATGTVEHIHIAGRPGAVPEAAADAQAEAGLGLRGEYHFGREGSDDLTLIEAEALERLAAEHGVELAPGASLRNLTTRGVDLGELVGRRFRVGGAVCEGLERCEPCNGLARRTDRRVLRGLVHTGLSAAIVESGTIRVGDPVEALP
jgi:hypothetical protein